MKSLIEYTLLALLAVLVIGSLLGALLDRPVFISYAYSGSMAPTIDKGDVFFINPFVRNPKVGDIVVFRAGKTWVVHRIVAITEEGYLTKGDNNIATDQQTHNVPPVAGEQIGGRVITVNGHVPKIPELGNYIDNGLSDRGKMFLGALLVVVGIIAFGSGERPKRIRKNKFISIKFRTLFMLTSVFLILMVAISIFVSWELIPIAYSVTSAGGSREGWYLPGEEFQTEVTIRNNNIYPMVYYISAEPPVTEVSSEKFYLSRDEEDNLIVTIVTPQTTAMYTTKVRVNAYPKLLPSSLMDSLYSIHPMMPLLAILTEVAAFLGALYYLSGIGDEDVLRIRRKRTSSLRGITEVFRI